MIYHFFIGSETHHVPDMIRLLETHAPEIGVGPGEQVFLLFATGAATRRFYERLPLPPDRLVFHDGEWPRSSSFARVELGDLAFIHSAFFPGLWRALRRHERIWPRTALIVWGGELAIFELQNRLRARPGRDSLRECLAFQTRGWPEPGLGPRARRAVRAARSVVARFADPWLRDAILPKLGAICTLTPGEFRRIDAWHGPCHNDFAMAYCTNDRNPAPAPRRAGRYRVMLGNSAAKTNQHLEVLPWLARFAREPMEVVCPLAYPRDPAYVERVVGAGRSLLGERFVPWLEMLEKGRYTERLASIDLLIHNARRQQGMYCIWSSLLSGKKVYLSPESPVFEAMRDWGLRVFDVGDLASVSFDEFVRFPIDLQQRNHRLGSERFSLQATVGAWARLISWMRGTRLLA